MGGRRKSYDRKKILYREGDSEGGRRGGGRDSLVMLKQCGGVMPSFLSTVNNGRISAAVFVFPRWMC